MAIRRLMVHCFVGMLGSSFANIIQNPAFMNMVRRKIIGHSMYINFVDGYLAL